MKRSVLALLMVTCAISSKAYSVAGTQNSRVQNPNDTTGYSVQPLRLKSFNARILSANRVELGWVTAETWTNVTHYDIQRSFNSIAFETIGSVAQVDNRPIDQFYRFTDPSAGTMQNDVVYYRLKQVNRDGRISYSFIVPVKRNEENTAQLSVWPIPARTEINIGFNSNEAGEVTVNLVDITGRKVKTNGFLAETGRNTLQINEIDGLNAGVYIVQVWSGSSLLGSAKILKTH